MKQSSIDRFVGATLILIGLIIVGFVGLIGWALIEFILWLSSK